MATDDATPADDAAAIRKEIYRIAIESYWHGVDDGERETLALVCAALIVTGLIFVLALWMRGPAP